MCNVQSTNEMNDLNLSQTNLYIVNCTLYIDGAGLNIYSDDHGI